VSISQEQIGQAIVFLIALILSIAVHEFGHAFVADRLGDPLPRHQGRVTLNPIAHIDLWGTIVLPLVIVFSNAPLLGWGKPVQTNPLAYTRRLRMKTGHLIVAAAGPAMNLVLGVVVSLILVAYLQFAPGPQSRMFVHNTELLISLNFTLMFFNLIPLPPLDGGTVLKGLLPDRYDAFLEPLERYGSFVLLAVVATRLINPLLAPVGYAIGKWFELLGVPWI